MVNQHDRLVENLYSKLKYSGKYNVISKFQEFPLESSNKRTYGEVDLIAMNTNKSKLEIYEIKSSQYHMEQARKQLHRAKGYYKRFKFKKMKFFIYYSDNGLERLLQIRP